MSDPQTIKRLLSHARFLRREARTCGKAGAYFASCVIIGAALEAVLLATVLECEESLRSAGHWPIEKGKPVGTPPTKWSLGRLVGVAVKAEWLGVLDFDGGEGDNNAEVLWELRNLVHPGRFISERWELPGGFFDRSTYRDLDIMLKNAFDATAIAREQAET